MAAECSPRQLPSGAFTRVFIMRWTWRWGSPSRLVKWRTRAVSTVRLPTSTWAPRGPIRVTATAERYRGDLVGLAVEHGVEGGRNHRVLRGHDGQRLGVVDHHFDETQRLAVRPAGADEALHLPALGVDPLHPFDEIAFGGQGGPPGPLPRFPGVDLHGHPGVLAVVGLGPLVALVEVFSGADSRAPVKVHPSLHRRSSRIPGPWTGRQDRPGLLVGLPQVAYVL